MLTIWPRPPRLNGHTTRHHQQQSGPAATCPMMAACGVGCWVPSSTGWCRRRCRACARPRRGPGAVGGRSLWSAPAPAPVASCAALRRRSRYAGRACFARPLCQSARAHSRPCGRPARRGARSWLCAALAALCGAPGPVVPSRVPVPLPRLSWLSCGLLGAPGGSVVLLVRPAGAGPSPWPPPRSSAPGVGVPPVWRLVALRWWPPRCVLFWPAPGALPLRLGGFPGARGGGGPGGCARACGPRGNHGGGPPSGGPPPWFGLTVQNMSIIPLIFTVRKTTFRGKKGGPKRPSALYLINIETLTAFFLPFRAVKSETMTAFWGLKKAPIPGMI